MSFLGDIVEHGTAEPTVPELTEHSKKTGFPELRKFLVPKKESRFKRKETPKPEPKKETPPVDSKAEPISEAKRIHEENLKKIMLMSPDQFVSERDELFQGLDPKLLEGLKKRSEKKEQQHAHAEGRDGWIGGGRNGVELPHLDSEEVNKALGIKSVKFVDKPVEHQIMESVDSNDEQEAEEADEIAPEGYQLVPEEEAQDVEMHFPKPKLASEDPDMDLNDPDFLDKLHEKYYPDLPKETSKLAWMKAQEPQKRKTSYEAITDMRFDFKGNLIELDANDAGGIPLHLGLHHHSADPHMAGYTLPELAHLARSTVPTQRCIAIQTLGRILHKLGLHKYNIMPLQDEDENPMTGEILALMKEFELMMWDLIEQLRLTETLTEAADEKKTRNISVRAYAIEALWLWKQGGGKPEDSRRSEEDIIAEQLQQM